MCITAKVLHSVVIVVGMRAHFPSGEPWRDVAMETLSVCGIFILLTFWCPLLPHGYSYKASCARPG